MLLSPLFRCGSLLAISLLAGCATQVTQSSPPPMAKQDLISTESRIIYSPLSLEQIIATPPADKRAAFAPKDGAIVLDPESLNLLLRAIQSDRRTSNFSSPRVTAYDKATSTIFFSAR